ncbi:MAG: hypothetical protein JJU11_11405 [Candidatus Sumerlaeia bacterium]|nr:hypothetical protein [Candidatus Sumerlaeia bacterium]
MKILVMNDTLKLKKGGVESFSGKWESYSSELGVEVIVIEGTDPRLMTELMKSDGFMTRFSTGLNSRRDCNRLLNLAETVHGLPVYPNYSTRWFYEDKVVQAQLFDSSGIVSPKTTVVYSLEDALAFLHKSTFPIVLKLATGASSSNVTLLRSKEEGIKRAHELFGSGLFTLAHPQVGPFSPLRRAYHSTRYFLTHRLPPLPHDKSLEQGYMLFQEFIADNDGDIRVNVIGDRVWGYRRLNLPGDFRASGSGVRDYDHTKIPESALKTAVMLADKLNSQSLVLDFLEQDGQSVLVEISYTTSPEPVANCPGHWKVSRRGDDFAFNWIDKPLRIEKAILEDFVAKIRGVPQGSLAQ